MDGPRAGARAVLVLGEEGGLARALVRRLQQDPAPVHEATAASDSELAELLAEDRWRAVCVVTRDDVMALRLTLLSAHLRADLPLWVTIFDRTITRELQHVAPALHIISPAQLAADQLAEECLRSGVRARGRAGGVRLVDDALRLLVRAGAGLASALVVQAVITMIALHKGLVDGLYFSTRSVATVAEAPGASSGPVWFKLLSSLDTVAAVVLLAIFTAALVRRLSRPRLTTLVGRLAAPARGHVVVVGFGQIGFRLAQSLQRRGVTVLGVERDPEAPCVRLARAAGIPVAIARGDDRETLERVGIRRCGAVAAVTSADLVNVAVGLTADELAPELPLILRLGDGDVAAETDSLLHLGHIFDVHRIAAEELAQGLCGAGGAVAPDEPLG